MLPTGFIQDLLSRVDVVEVVGRHVELKKAGINHKGLCPFHGEKSPSFIVSPTRQTYHCFGCGVHGNAVGFLMEHAGRFAMYGTNHAGEARELAAKLAAEGEPIVIAAGGDGTLNEVVSGLAGSSTVLGVLPPLPAALPYTPNWPARWAFRLIRWSAPSR